MTAPLQPYAAYKDSEVPWLGRVPKHWEARQLKYLLREIDSRSAHGDECLLSVSQYTGVTPRRTIENSEEQHTRAKTLIGYRKVEADDLVINIMLAWNGSMGVSAYAGVVSPAYCVYRFAPTLAPWYFHHLLKSPTYRDRIKTASSGVVESRLRLYTEDLGRIEAILPPPSEQATIVRFLEAQDRLIGKYIRAKQKLIGLLNEQKQAIIQRAVTRGLNPDVRMKASGVEWLGDVPEHWGVMLNQRIFKEEIRAHNGRPETQLSLSQRDGLIATVNMQERSLQTATFDNWKVTIPGDLVLNRFKAHLGVFFAATLRGIVSFHYGVFAPRVSLATKYFELLYHTAPYRTIYAGRSNGMTVGLQNLSNQSFYNVRSVVPPIEEQRAIVTHADAVTERLKVGIEAAKHQIALMREYRTRLISNVVTGKLDVRGVPVEAVEEDVATIAAGGGAGESTEPDETEGVEGGEDV